MQTNQSRAWEWLTATMRFLSGDAPAANAETQARANAAPDPDAPQDDAEGMMLTARARVCSLDDGERYVGGLVVVPGDDNAYGDMWMADDIRRMSHRFVERYRHIDTMHTSVSQAVPVESVYFPTPEEGGQPSYQLYGQQVPAGSWWLGVRVLDTDAWDAVKQGKYRGFSLFAVKSGHGRRNAGRDEFSQAFHAARQSVDDLSKGMADASKGASAAYASPGHGHDAEPGQRRMSADDWEVTMVSLVDNPAVYRATFFRAMRQPDGSASLQHHDGTPVNDGVLTLIRAAVDRLAPSTGQGVPPMEMQGFRTFDVSDDEHALYRRDIPQGDAPESGDGQDAEPQSRANDAPPAEPPADGQNDAPTDATPQSAPAITPEMVAQSVKDAIAPLQKQLNDLSARQNGLMAAGGALPNSDGGDDGDGEAKYNGAPSWASNGVGASKSNKRAVRSANGRA